MPVVEKLNRAVSWHELAALLKGKFMAFVTKPDLTIKKVKNLGWLFRYARKNAVKTLEWRDGTDVRNNIFRVYFKDGTLFETKFSDLSIFQEMIKRQRWARGLVVNYIGATGEAI